jgi:hypothetical protein
MVNNQFPSDFILCLGVGLGLGLGFGLGLGLSFASLLNALQTSGVEQKKTKREIAVLTSNVNRLEMLTEVLGKEHKLFQTLVAEQNTRTGLSLEHNKELSSLLSNHLSLLEQKVRDTSA